MALEDHPLLSPIKERDLELVERHLPLLLSYLRKKKKGKGPARITLEDRLLGRKEVEQLLLSYFSRLRSYFPPLSKVTPRRIRKVISVYRNDYDRIVALGPDHKSSAVKAGELTLLTRIRITKLPYRSKLERVRQQIITRLSEILVLQARKREARIRREAARRLLNRLSELIYDKPFRKLSEEEKRHILRVAHKDIHERHLYRDGIITIVRRSIFFPTRVRHIRLIKDMLERGEDLWDIYLELRKFQRKRYRTPPGVNAVVEWALELIAEHWRDPYLFLMNSIEESLGKLGFYLYRIGPYALVGRPYPGNASKRGIRDLHRLFLRLGVKSFKIYIRTPHRFIDQNFLRLRNSPYARYPTYIDPVSLKEKPLVPRNNHEAVLRIEINVPDRLRNNPVYMYLFRLVLLLLANLCLGLGPRSTDLIYDLLSKMYIGTPEPFLKFLFGSDLLYLQLYFYKITKWWNPSPPPERH